MNRKGVHWVIVGAILAVIILVVLLFILPALNIKVFGSIEPLLSSENLTGRAIEMPACEPYYDCYYSNSCPAGMKVLPGPFADCDGVCCR